MVCLVSEGNQNHLKFIQRTERTWQKLRSKSFPRASRARWRFYTGDSMLCCGRSKEQNRDIPPNAEPAASPRRLQFGQIASSTLPPGAGRGAGRGRELPPMVLQPDFRKVSGISSEIFRQLETVENDHDATTAAALGAVERRGEMLVRILDPRASFSRPVQDSVRKFLSMQDANHTVHFVEIVKRPGQTLGLYIREGNGLDRYDGVFVSRIAIESAVFNSGCLGVGDEILAVNLVDVTRMSLDDVVILMSIPRRLVLTIRQRKGGGPMITQSQSMLSSQHQYGLGSLPQGAMHMSYPGGYPGFGRGRVSGSGAGYYSTPGQRLFGSGHPGPGMGRQVAHGQGHSSTIGYSSQQHVPPFQSLPRPSSYQSPYANVPMQPHQLPDVAEYSRVPTTAPRHEDFGLDHVHQITGRRSQYEDYYDSRIEAPPPRPSSQQSSYAPYAWYSSREQQPSGSGPISYQPPPPVITEQPRATVAPSHFQPLDRMYPKTLESLAEKVHTFHTGPRPSRHSAEERSRMHRTGSDHRITFRGEDQPRWYGSMPRPSRSVISSEYRGGRGYIQARGSRIAGIGRRKGPVDYASDSEAVAYTPSIRSSLPMSTRRSLGLMNGRSNSLPRDLLRGRGGRKPGVRFDKRGGPDITSGLIGRPRRPLLFPSGIDSQDESDGALSAPEMPLTPRRERGGLPSSSVFTSAEYRAWMSRAPSTSAIYERLKSNKDSDLLQAQKAAKLTFSAENLSLLDRARTRTERQLKLLTESFERENQANLAQWEALRNQDRPYYSYRSHLTSGDSTLARALGRQQAPSAQGLLDITNTTSMGMRESMSSEPLRRLILPASRSRDILTNVISSTDVSSPLAGQMTSATNQLSGRMTPSSLLHRMKAEKEDSLIRKDLLPRSLIARSAGGQTASEILHPRRDQFKEEIDEKTEKLSSRLNNVSAHGTPASAVLGATASPNTRRGMSGSVVSGSMITQSSTATTTSESRSKLLTINPAEFIKYKMERPASSIGPPGDDGNAAAQPGHSGILRVHLLAGRALRSTVRTTDASMRTRDLYCVLECDRVHKARTVVCTGDQNFDWDEMFELDLIANKELDFLIYSWDPQLRHRLCYKGSVNLLQVLQPTTTGTPAVHQLAIKVEPRGTLYVKLYHTIPEDAFKRNIKNVGLFGANLADVVLREDSGLNVPLIVQRCIEEIERRGLDIIGLYRLCGSATKKQTLRDAFERNPRNVDLSAENVPDINVITGVLKDYLRELPEPLLTKCLYQMLFDAIGVCLPDDPEGNARLLFSIIECLPKPNRCTLLLILEHLSLVCSLSDRNKMGPTQLAQCFGTILMVHYDGTTESLDFQPPIKIVQYLLEVWPAKSVNMLQTVRAAGAEAVRKGPSLLGKGRPFPRSNPATVLLSKSQKTFSKTTTTLPLSPSKQSPGSHSESSPSPTSVHSRGSIPSLHDSKVVATTSVVSTTSSLAMTSSSMMTSVPTFTTSALASATPNIFTMTPSTTSGSLTSAATPSSLTPISQSLKPMTSATFSSSNYSLTSEFSTTSVTSPTPRHGEAQLALSSSEEFYTQVSVKNRVTAFEKSGTDDSGIGEISDRMTDISTIGGLSDLEKTFKPTTNIVTTVSTPSKPPDVTASTTSHPVNQPMIPPSPLLSRKYMPALPGRAERSDSVDETSMAAGGKIISSGNVPTVPRKRSLPSIPHTFAHPDFKVHSTPTPVARVNTNGIASSVQNKKPISGKPTPPIPPPKPSRPRLSSSDSEDLSFEEPARAAPHPKANGHISNDNHTTNGSISSLSSGGSSSTTPPTTKAAPAVANTNGEGSKGSSTTASPGPGTPGSTPPPVPPRLDRRPSLTSPTSSPPSIPPPVPPRLGRAAPVRTPSFDGRDSFEVDCYTIKEENGEEDFLT